MRSERWLTRRAARGDREAFAAIFQRHQQDIYRYCVAILGDPDDAQDALQNTMVKALRALPGERREIALKPWLFRIAHNEAIELRRHERPSAPLADVEVPAGTSLEQLAAERGRLRELLADLALLPVRQRGALVMRELAGFDFEQIGAALETTPAAARQTLYEARCALREMGEGREMRCDAVTVILSDGDGRVARRRDLRAHLRGCSDCRAFAEEIRTRGETFAAIAPLPALAAAAMIKGALAASSGSAAAGSSVAGGSSTAVAAAAAAKAGSTAALVKSAIGVVAIVAVGAVAADRTHLVDLGGSGGGAPAANSASGAGSPSRAAWASEGSTSGAGEAGAAVDQRREAIAMRPADRGRRRTGVGHHAGRGKADQAAGNQTTALVATAATGAAHGNGNGGRQARGAERSAGAAGTVHPPHPAHPGHPARPTHPDHPPHPSHSPPRTPGHPAHPLHPAHPTTPAGNSAVHPPQSSTGPKGEAARSTGNPHADGSGRHAAATATDTAPPTVADPVTGAAPDETVPGQGRKAAEEPAG